MGTAGNWFIKDCWEVWAESWLQKVLRQAKKMPSSCNIQYIPLHVSSMEEELEETPDKRKVGAVKKFL